MRIARGTQKPGQTKEQTRLIAQGIQKGIEQYKKQQSTKTRELDKRLKKATTDHNVNDSSAIDTAGDVVVKSCKLPWVLLILSWIGFTVVALLMYIK